MIFWIVLLTSCAVATVVSTILWKSPMVAAIGVSILAGIVVALHEADTSAFWALGTVVVIICSAPVTVVSAIVTENLMDKYAPNWKN